MLKRHPYVANRKNYIIPFSLFQIFFNIFVIANIFLSVVIIVDFFLQDVEQKYFIKMNIGTLYYLSPINNSPHSSIEITNKDRVKWISEGDTITYYITPIFKFKKSYKIVTQSGKIITKQGAGIVYAVLLIFFNIVAFSVFIFKSKQIYFNNRESALHDKYEIEKSLVFGGFESFFTILIIFNIYFWVKLYKFLVSLNFFK